MANAGRTDLDQQGRSNDVGDLLGLQDGFGHVSLAATFHGASRAPHEWEADGADHCVYQDCILAQSAAGAWLPGPHQLLLMLRCQLVPHLQPSTQAHLSLLLPILMCNECTHLM